MVNLRAYRHLLFAVLLWMPIGAWSQEKDDLRNLSFFTESYPPANFLVNDNITGLTSLYVRALGYKVIS